MAKVQFRNKTNDELAVFIGHNGWNVVQPGDLITVPDDDVVTAPQRARGGEIVVVKAATEDAPAETRVAEVDEVLVPAVSSADSYRAAKDQWTEVTASAPPAAPVPTAPPAPPAAPAAPSQGA